MPAAPGGTTTPRVLTDTATKDTPLRRQEVYRSDPPPAPGWAGYLGRRTFAVNNLGVTGVLHLAQFLLEVAHFVAQPGGQFKLQFRRGGVHLFGH
ncbi:hypothetical protein ABIB35_003629 [Arthrobacter sp. UYP6]